MAPYTTFVVSGGGRGSAKGKAKVASADPFP